MPELAAMEHAIKYIKSNWKEGKTLKEVAELHGVNAGNLERSFHKREGMTFKQFVDQLRKEYVISKLGERDLYGYEIGTELGFVSDLAFYRWVKRAFGVSFTKLHKKAKSDLRKTR